MILEDSIQAFWDADMPARFEQFASGAASLQKSRIVINVWGIVHDRDQIKRLID